MHRSRIRLAIRLMTFGVVLLVTLSVALTSNDQPVRLRVSAVLDGVGHRKWAVLALKNSSGRAILYRPLFPQTKRGQDWRPNDSGFDQPPLTEQYRAATLQPHQEARFAVQLPEEETARVPVIWDFGPTKMDRIRTICRENWKAWRGGRPLPGWSVVSAGQIRTLYSAEIQRSNAEPINGTNSR